MLAALALVFTMVTVVGSTPVGAEEPESRPFITVNGHGWGHGRGMGQWGSQGYALAGWSSAQILDHFYGGTSAGTVGTATSAIQPPIDPAAVRVEIIGQRSNAMRVNIGIGTLDVVNPATGALVYAGAPGETIHLQVANGGLRLRVSSSCFDTNYTTVLDFAETTLEVRPVTTDGGPDGLIRLCKPDGSSTWYEGAFQANNLGGQTRSVNVVSIETYLRGVVPNEVPAGWEPAALQAQAVAARSYAMAGDTRQHPYADTCDTILCQVYQGRFRQLVDGPMNSSTDDRTDAAIAATAGVIRVKDGSGNIARTEFSASTGGHTAGGDFPAVADDGDATPENPRHDWEITVDLADLENATNKGMLLEARVTERNGLGQDGGRVEEIQFIFEQGSVTMSGNDARRKFGLYSDWFTVSPVQRLFANTAAAQYVVAMFELFLGRPATPAEQAQWIDEVETGRSHLLTEGLAVSDEWAGVVVDGFYQAALGRGADEEGREFWRSQIAGGVRVESVGARFYGSTEYFDRAGGTNRTFVAALYRDLLERSPDDTGLDHWSGLLDDGSRTTSEVAEGFYASIESRRSRVITLYERVLDRGPDASGLEFWAEQLLSTDDIRLASQLAASDESFALRTSSA